MHPPRCCQLGATPQRRVTMRSSRSPLRPTRDRIAGLVTCATTPRRLFVRITTLENFLAPFTTLLKVFPPALRTVLQFIISFPFHRLSQSAPRHPSVSFDVSSIEPWADTYRTHSPFQDIEIATFDNLKREDKKLAINRGIAIGGHADTCLEMTLERGERGPRAIHTMYR